MISNRRNLYSDHNYRNSIGVDFKLKKESVGNYKAKIQIWDTGYVIFKIIFGILNNLNSKINEKVIR